MEKYNKFNKTFDEIIKMKYADVINTIYDAIPTHDIDTITPQECSELLGYYPALYATLSHHFSMLIERTTPRIYDNIYYLKQAYEQALKVVRFIYDGLSRKITVNEDEKKLQWANNK